MEQLRKRIILAEKAFQGAARKKNRPRAPDSGKRRFFTAMEIMGGNLDIFERLADARPVTFPIGRTLARTEPAGAVTRTKKIALLPPVCRRQVLVLRNHSTVPLKIFAQKYLPGFLFFHHLGRGAATQDMPFVNDIGHIGDEKSILDIVVGDNNADPPAFKL